VYKAFSHNQGQAPPLSARFSPPPPLEEIREGGVNYCSLHDLKKVHQARLDKTDKEGVLGFLCVFLPLWEALFCSAFP